ncbi:MAG: PorT family protein [Desulfobacterales bacterium]|nr:PorT family protein [Desulfobacterales bacterium]
MKKTVLVLASVLVLAGLVVAPAAAANSLNFGLKAGMSLSNIAWNDDDGLEKMLIRPTFGAFALYNLSPTLAIQVDIDYMTTGEWWQDEGKIVETFNYLHIPVVLKARLVKEGKLVPFFLAGPAVGFLLSAKENDIDIKPWFKSTDFGADLGFGAEVAAGEKMKAFLEARFYLGLTNVYSPDLIMLAPIEYTMKNRALLVTVGLIF